MNIVNLGESYLNIYVVDFNELDRKDTMLLKLLPDKLQSRLKGCLIDIDDIEFGTQLGKGTYR